MLREYKNSKRSMLVNKTKYMMTIIINLNYFRRIELLIILNHSRMSKGKNMDLENRKNVKLILRTYVTRRQMHGRCCDCLAATTVLRVVLGLEYVLY